SDFSHSESENRMNAMRILAVGVLVGLVSFAARAEDKEDNAKLIVGKWECTKADEGTLPVGSTVEFTKDGKMIVIVKADGQETKGEGTYKVEGDKFDFTIKIGEQEHSETINIKKLTKTELNTTNKEGKVVDLTRKK